MEGIGEGINIGYGFMVPYPFSGLEMPPDIGRLYLLGGKKGAETEKDDEKEYEDTFFFFTHDSVPYAEVIPPQLKDEQIPKLFPVVYAAGKVISNKPLHDGGVENPLSLEPLL